MEKVLYPSEIIEKRMPLVARLGWRNAITAEFMPTSEKGTELARRPRGR